MHLLLPVSSNSNINCYVNAIKSYLHFGCFAENAVLCSNFFVFIWFPKMHLISFIKIELLCFQSWTESWIVCFTHIFSKSTKFCQNFVYICQLKMPVTTLLHSHNEKIIDGKQQHHNNATALWYWYWNWICGFFFHNTHPGIQNNQPVKTQVIH